MGFTDRPRQAGPTATVIHLLAVDAVADIQVDHGLLDRLGIKLAYVFGSRAGGNHQAGSDLDIAIMGEEPLALVDSARLARIFAEASGVPEVDVVDLRAAPLSLAGRVAQEGKAVHCADEAARVRFEATTRTRYLDFLPMLRRHDRAFVAHVAEHGL